MFYIVALLVNFNFEYFNMNFTIRKMLKSFEKLDVSHVSPNGLLPWDCSQNVKSFGVCLTIDGDVIVNEKGEHLEPMDPEKFRKIRNDGDFVDAVFVHQHMLFIVFYKLKFEDSKMPNLLEEALRKIGK
jgi:hypothetical protein